MKLTIAAVGRLKAGAESELVARYAERAGAAGRSLGLELAIREVTEGRQQRAEDRREHEGQALAAVMPPASVLVALDEGGRSLTSASFAEMIARQRDGGTRDLVFVIGGADGLAPALRQRAATIIAFGAMTWPHQMVRAMLAEQIYRAITILSGHPYHRAG